MEDLDDLLVRVQRKGTRGAEARRYTVEMVLSGGRRMQERPEFTLDDYQPLAASDPRAIAAHGIALFNRLFAGNLAVTFQQAWATAGARRRRLRFRLALDPQAPALHAVPWELLHFDDSGGLAPPRPIALDARLIFSRYIDSADFAEAPPVAHRPVRLLVVFSAPRDLDAWGLASFNRTTEESDFRARFTTIEHSGQFQCDVLPVASAAALHSALIKGHVEDRPDAEPRARGYDVLLYYGHALHHAQSGSRLVLEHPETRRVQLYNGLELVSRIQKLPDTFRPAMVVLVACNSAAVAGDLSLNSLAARMMTDGGVPAVLAMQRLVEIAVARSFTFDLSEHLLRDGMIDTAVNAARYRIFESDTVSWTTPVLYMRHADGRLFTPNAQLEYVESVLRNPMFLRWRGPEFIDLGVLMVAPGQDWRLLRYRPEDAPAAAGVLEVFTRSLISTYANDRRRKERGLSAGNLFALIGPPHSGQTTVLQRLCYDLAEAVTRRSEPPPPLVPGIFISLAGYELQRGAGRLERHIVEQARAVTPALGELLSGLFRPQGNRIPPVQQPQFVFLLDDLDAVPEKSRHDFAVDLADLAERLPDQTFVMTASFDAFPGQLLPNAHVLVIQPLTEQQIVNYLRNRDEARAQQILRQIRENRLLSLAGEPSLLALIYERLAVDSGTRVTRNQLVQEYLDRALASVTPRFALGDAARESLAALAWYGRWNHKEQLTLNEIFRILAIVRRDRDYSLEELYALLIDARLLSGVGQHAARFVNPALFSYCAAVRLVGMPNARSRIADIITLCNNNERLSWWEDVIYFLTGLLRDPAPLFSYLAAAIRGGSAVHPLIAARCLEALPMEQEERLPAAMRAELLDACVLRLRADREPIAERREQIVNALGRLSYAQVRHELRRILVEKVRHTTSGSRYEYTNVRIAAARALRTIYSPGAAQLRREPLPLKTTTQSVASLVLSDGGDEVSLVDPPPAERLGIPAGEEEVRTEQMLVGLMRTWNLGSNGRDEFLRILRESPQPPERAIAAFALGDMPDTASRKLLDARALLRVIVPVNIDQMTVDADQEDTMWAAADALTLFDPDQVAPLLAGVIERSDQLPDSAIQQLAYLAGRVRIATEPVRDWLITLLICHPSQTIKSKALQSLAWMGRDIPRHRLDLPDGRPGPSLKELVQAIAAGRPVQRLKLGEYVVKLRAGDTDRQPFYLRRKAVEALAWIGDQATLRDLGEQFATWPLELREYWYSTAANIERRMANGDGATR
jgi:hypothetical protein